MQKLPPVLSLQELEEYRDKLKQQQAAVSRMDAPRELINSCAKS